MDNSNRAVFTKVRNIRIFKRNVDECIVCCRYNINPDQRIRFNHPASPSPTRPSARDLGYIFLDLAVTLTDLSANLMKMSNYLINDELLESNFEHSRKLIQNNFDTLRYLAPLMKNLSSLAIPVGGPKELVKLGD